MKNNPVKRKIESIPNFEERKFIERVKKDNFSPKVINTMITEELVMPPARVWDKIEKILDEQDHRKKIANSIISASFRGLEDTGNSKNLYIAAFAAFSIIAGVIWKIS